jgi:hypothetical protein
LNNSLVVKILAKLISEAQHRTDYSTKSANITMTNNSMDEFRRKASQVRVPRFGKYCPNMPGRIAEMT